MKNNYKKLISWIKKNKKTLLFFLFLISGLLSTLYVEYKFQYQQFKWLAWRVLVVSGAIVQYGAIEKRVRKKYTKIIIKLLIVFFFLYIINFFANSINIYHLEKFESINNYCNLNPNICYSIQNLFFHLKIYRFVSLTSYFFYYTIFLLIGLLFSEKIYNQAKKIWKKIPKVKIKFAWQFYFLIIYLIFQQLISVFSLMSKKIIKILYAFEIPFEERWEPLMGGRYSFGWIDTYSKFINSKVPREATLLIPNQTGPWEMEGNRWYYRWFVYPRDLVQMLDQPEIPKEANYALITYGVFGYHKNVFPNFKIPKEKIDKIILVDQKTLEEAILPAEAFYPDNYQNKWGVIKFK